MSNPTARRYDVDWLRVCALGLLVLYHLIVAFQTFGREVFFITNEQSMEILWVPMALLNMWRIPLLFIVSGMGVYFMMERRT